MRESLSPRYLDCPFCGAHIPGLNGFFIGKPTIRCWNCKSTFPAPDSWRDFKPDRPPAPPFLYRVVNLLYRVVNKFGARRLRFALIIFLWAAIILSLATLLHR